MRILICTDSVVNHTGLAESTRHIFLPLRNLYPNKYDLHQLGYFHVNPKEVQPWPIYQTQPQQLPNGAMTLDQSDKYGQKSFDRIVQQVKPDIVFGYGDIWHFQAMIDSPFRNNYRLVVYYTVDGEPYMGSMKPENHTEWGSKLARADQVVTLSHFGERTLRASCPEMQDRDIKVMYHPLELQRYPQYTAEERLGLRKNILPPVLAKDAFLVGWIGRNQFRKQNHKLWELCHYMVHGDYIECQTCKRITLKEWDPSTRATRRTEELTLYDPGYTYGSCWHCGSAQVQPGQADPLFYLWLHMSRNDPGYSCELEEYIWRVTDHCIYTSNLNEGRAVSKEDIARLLGCWDAHYYPSGGEGFGNPAFESLAAGCPVLFSNYSSHAEFCRFGGLPVRVASYQAELQSSIRRCTVDTNHAIEQMLKLRRSKKLREQLGAAGRLHAAKFSLDQMGVAWDHIFDDVMKMPLPAYSNTLYTAEV